ncbi:MAG: TolC family protein [Bacteroidia bacterium]|nr:TolC family protein [Bacteroidia bacterium]MBP6721149.1 TolC family protein [Bacteroidia bacterium]
MKYCLILLAMATILGKTGLHAQSNLDNVLSTVATNNKTFKAQSQYWEAQKASYKTGLSPTDPVVGFDYMIGSPATAGNQTDLTVTQLLDFPTAYAKKQQLSEAQTGQAQWQVQAARRDLLLETKKVCLNLVYHRQLQTALARRLARAEQLRDDFQRKMDKGDGNVLDLNKARLQWVAIQQESQENRLAISVLESQLVALNGGTALEFTDSIYPLATNIGSFESLEKEIESADPMRNLLAQEVTIAQKELEVSKALKLPRLEVGYHYQGILGQSYNGVHTGVSVPLWEHRNTTELRQVEIAVAGLELQDHLNAHYFEIKELYGRFKSIESAMETYRALLTDLNSETLLTKALALGQISVIEFFMELSYYYDAHNTLLSMEREYQLVLADLLKHRL